MTRSGTKRIGSYHGKEKKKEGGGRRTTKKRNSFTLNSENSQIIRFKLMSGRLQVTEKQGKDSFKDGRPGESET